jgi:hypothetical protein
MAAPAPDRVGAGWAIGSIHTATGLGPVQRVRSALRSLCEIWFPVNLDPSRNSIAPPRAPSFLAPGCARNRSIPRRSRFGTTPNVASERVGSALRFDATAKKRRILTADYSHQYIVISLLAKPRERASIDARIRGGDAFVITLTVRFGLLLGALAAGCAATGSATRSAETPAPRGLVKAPTDTVQAPGQAATVGTPADVKTLLRDALAAVGKGQLAEGHALLDRARALATTDHNLDLKAVYVGIAVFTNEGDYEGAARVVLEAIQRRNGDPSDSALPFFHNAMAILREAQGDLPGALLESAERTAAGYEGTWEPAAERIKQTRFKNDWHRAYLSRMYAEQLTGTQRESALLAAAKARKDYVAAGGYPDSIAVLDALFAMYDRRWDDVRTAVRKVDITKDDDEEDLYLLFSALDAAGDHEASAAIRRRIEQKPPSWGVWRAWLKSDTDGAAPSMKHFSPRYPTGRRP